MLSGVAGRAVLSREAHFHWRLPALRSDPQRWRVMEVDRAYYDGTIEIDESQVTAIANNRTGGMYVYLKGGQTLHIVDNEKSQRLHHKVECRLRP